MKKTPKIFLQGIKFLNSKYPIICGAMSYVSTPKLVAAVNTNGGFGCLSGSNLSAKELEKQLDKTRKLTDREYAVSLITISPHFHEHLYLCCWKKIPHVIFAGSYPKKNEIRMMKESGAKVTCFAPTLSIAKRMVRYGVDALILEGNEAGGYVGRKGLNILLQEILFENFEVPIFVAGGLFNGKLAAHMLMMGAAGIVLGTRFAASVESGAHKNFKEKFIAANGRDSIMIPQFDSELKVNPARTIRNELLTDFNKLRDSILEKFHEGKLSRTRAQKIVGYFWVHTLKSAVMKGNIEKGALMAGQSVGLIKKEQSVKEIINEIISEILNEIDRTKELL